MLIAAGPRLYDALAAKKKGFIPKPTSVEIGGRFVSESVAVLRRITHPCRLWSSSAPACSACSRRRFSSSWVAPISACSACVA